MAETLTKQYVEGRIDDWKARIRSLYDNLRVWARERPEWIIEPGEVMQRNEQLMMEKGIRPKKLATLNFHKGTKRVGFVPSALWVVGADGRINIIANEKMYILVDMRDGHAGQSNWRITFPAARPKTTAFSMQEFLRILDESDERLCRVPH